METDRVGNAIKLLKECSIFLENTSLERENCFYQSLVVLSIYLQLFTGHIRICDYTSAMRYGEKLLEVFHRVVATDGSFKVTEVSIALQLVNLYNMNRRYKEAKDLLERALIFFKDTGDRYNEAMCYSGLADFFFRVGQHQDAIKHHEKSLEVRKAIGDKTGIASSFCELGFVFEAVGHYEKAMEYIQKALSIGIEKGEGGQRIKEAEAYIKIGKVFFKSGKCAAGINYIEKALAIDKEINHREGVASCYYNLGTCYMVRNEYTKALPYFEKSLFIISNETCTKEGEGLCCLNMGYCYLYFGEYAKAKEYIENALNIQEEIGNVDGQLVCQMALAQVMFAAQTADEDTIATLVSIIQKTEGLVRSDFLGKNDELKVSILNKHSLPYQLLSSLFCFNKEVIKALHVLELGRARALADLMSTQYFAGKQRSVDPQSWVGIEKIIKLGSDYTCLYISYFHDYIFLWILIGSDFVVLWFFCNVDVPATGLLPRPLDLNEFFGKESFRGRFLPERYCEDRSLQLLLFTCSSQLQVQEDRIAALRLVEKDEEEDQDQEPRPTLDLLYKLIIAPIMAEKPEMLLEKPEILIVPDRSLYKVPFAALKDENGKYLSETFRIRSVPSLTTLKLILERPVNQSSQDKASVLIVGDPDVSYLSELSQLDFARKEARMIAGLLGVQPLVGCQATKEAVLEAMHLASLIHFAAHGDAERGEIALAPVRPINRILNQDDFLLTMSDVSQVQLTAKLVVLSCCHSGRGHVRAEGVVGIARAFLGSGARSVLVALWAIEDKATEQFMGRFYETLVRGESASESLHQAMKWMRENGFPEVRQWAPFMLIGDNVTFDFRK